MTLIVHGGPVPEGDSLHRLAAALRPTFLGAAVSGLTIRSQGDIALADQQITDIVALGKHLLITFSSDQTLRVHLGMYGRARVMPRERCTKALSFAASCVLFGEQHALAVFRARRAELLCGTAGVKRALSHLGPDLLAPEVDYDSIMRRLSAPVYRVRAIGEVLLDQRVACGIGNVYKSEALFVAGLHPQTPVRLLSAEQCLQVYRAAAALMASNLGPGPRVTRRSARPPGGYPYSKGRRYSVYRRNNQPCDRCGTLVQRIYQGDQARSTYFCPCCQPAHVVHG